MRVYAPQILSGGYVEGSREPPGQANDGLGKEVVEVKMQGKAA